MLMRTNRGIVGDCMPKQERYAAEVLAVLLEAEWEARDVPGADDMHDFDLVLSDGRRIAVEVVSDTSETDASFRAQIDRINPMPVDSLQGWQVDLYTPGEHAQDARSATRTVRRLQNELPDLLKKLEDADPDPFENNHFHIGRGQRRGEHPSAVQLRELGIQSVSKKDHYVDKGKPYVLFGQAGSTSSFGASDVVDAIRSALDKKKVRIAKAHQTGVGEVHLFVWLRVGQEHSSNTPGLTAAENFGFGDEDPDFDLGETDKVWVTGYGLTAEGRLFWPVWSYSSGEGWCRHPSTVILSKEEPGHTRELSRETGAD